MHLFHRVRSGFDRLRLKQETNCHVPVVVGIDGHTMCNSMSLQCDSRAVSFADVGFVANCLSRHSFFASGTRLGRLLRSCTGQKIRLVGHASSHPVDGEFSPPRAPVCHAVSRDWYPHAAGERRRNCRGMLLGYSPSLDRDLDRTNSGTDAGRNPLQVRRC